MTRHVILAAFLGLASSSYVQGQDTGGAAEELADVESISIAEIVTATSAAVSDLVCLDFSVNGACFFLVCTPSGCTIETSIQYRHFNPSLIVTSYNTLGESPWDEARDAFGELQVEANDAQFSFLGIDLNSFQGGGKFADEKPIRKEEDAAASQVKHTVFKSAEVIGSPGNVLSIASNFGLPVFCPATDVTAFFPYFLSGVDAFAWRTGLTELFFPETFIIGQREIGDFPFNTWGSVHPRQGFLNTPEDPKAGAVMAQRAADIATREDQPHVYFPVGSVGGSQSSNLEVFEPGPVVERDPTNSKWQILVPVTEESCLVFGEDDDENVIAGFSGNRVSLGGDYAFALWRPYRCCEKKGIFLGAVEIQSP